MGPGLDARVLALSAFDDGSGPALHAGGLFKKSGAEPVAGIAKWTGEAWVAVGGGITKGESVGSLIVHDDGTGNALYACGRFTEIGGVAAQNIARWDGRAWTPVGGGIGYPVNALVVFDDGRGPALFAAGSFETAGGKGNPRLARWDGTEWTGVPGVGGHLLGAAVHDDGTGKALYVGGLLSRAGDLEVNGAARWDGQSWSALAGGTGGWTGSLFSFSDPSGSRLHAAVAFKGILHWDGEKWARLATAAGIDTDAADGPGCISAFDFGRGPRVCVGNWFKNESGETVGSLVAAWDDGKWKTLGGPLGGDVPPNPGSVSHFTDVLFSFDDGSGPALYLGGRFAEVAGVPASYVARWRCASTVGTWLRCDSNGDGKNDLADAVHLLAALFQGGPQSACMPAADCNGDDRLDVADPVYDLNFLFRQGAPPPGAYPDCDGFATCGRGECP